MSRLMAQMISLHRYYAARIRSMEPGELRQRYIRRSNLVYQLIMRRVLVGLEVRPAGY